MRSRFAHGCALLVGVLVAGSGVHTSLSAQSGRAATTAAEPQRGRGAGAQGRDAQVTAPAGTAMIVGRIVTGDSGTPVRRARVNLSGTELRGQRSTVTDDEGRFVFTMLPAGRYTMTASKAGFVTIAYGAKSAGRAGTPIQLEDGQKLESKPISLPKGGVVTGVVHDEYGEPSTGTQVRALRMVMRTGEKRLESAGTATTDDRGLYRIYGLQPGQYVVTAQPRNTGLAGLQTSVAAEIESALQQMQQALGRTVGGQAGQGGRAAGPGRGGQLGDLLQGLGGGRGQQVLEQLQQLDPDGQPSMGYAPVFYPGTTSPSGMTPIDVAVGQERLGVDFQLQLVSTSQITGTLTGLDGVVPTGAQVTLAPLDTLPGLPGATQTVRASQTGGFAFRNVTPGQYRLTARALIRTPSAAGETEVAATQGGRAVGGRTGRGAQGTPTEILWAHSEIAVDGRDLADVGLQLQKGMTISGRITFDSSKLLPPTDVSRVRVLLTAVNPQDGDFGGLPNTTVDASGRFTIIGVPPGRYSLRGTVPAAVGGAGNWILRSSTAGGRDTLDFPLEIGPNVNVADAVLTFSDQSTELTGVLQDAQGVATSDYSIIVFPIDSRFWVPQSRRIQSVRPGTDGRYTVRNLPPGDYGLAAVTDVEPGEWFDSAFLQELMGASMRISLAEGERKTQDIRLAGGLLSAAEFAQPRSAAANHQPDNRDQH